MAAVHPSGNKRWGGVHPPGLSDQELDTCILQEVLKLDEFI
jgi:hypothetical protein